VYRHAPDLTLLMGEWSATRSGRRPGSAGDKNGVNDE
jgi:hypothetical protein